MFDLNGKKALVTGSTQGIGFEIAKILSEHGATVYINGATGLEKVRSASEKIPNSIPVLADLTDRNGLERLYNETGDVDILVLNASVQYKRQWDMYSDEELEKQLNCNFISSYKLIKLYTPYMKDQKWGRIVTIGSVNQYTNHPELAIYSATKVAQKKLTDNIAPYLAPYGITLNNVAPGAIETPRNFDALSDEDYKKKVISRIPVGYIGKPQEIAPAVLLLCSNEGSYITGSEIIIDGGMHL